MTNELVEAAASKLLQRVETKNVKGIFVRKLSISSYEVETATGSVSISRKTRLGNAVTVTLKKGGFVLAEDQSADPSSAIVRLFDAMPELCELYAASRPDLNHDSKQKAADELIEGL